MTIFVSQIIYFAFISSPLDFSGEFTLISPTHAQAQSKVFGGVDCNCGLRGGGTVVPAATMFGSIVDDPCACIVVKLV